MEETPSSSNYDFNEKLSKFPKTPPNYIWPVLFCILILTLIGYAFIINRPPNDFPLAQPLTIEEGTSAKKIIDQLESQSYVKSATWLYLTLTLSFGAENIKAGVYELTTPLNTYDLARLITDSAPPGATVTLTLPEGFTAAEFAEIADKTLANFDVNTFIDLAKVSEGKLFPETYEVPTNYSESELVKLLLDTYDSKLEPLQTELTAHKLTEEEIIILASIVEREANTVESMRLVAGILSTRLSLGMPLQADATMEYVLNKPLKELTPEDLKIDSLYNTYLYKGLTPTPIGNPGLDSIQAVLNPEVSDYLFYLTDDEGNFYYAETYEQHQQNITRYLH